jgi:hypothetical protein
MSITTQSTEVLGIYLTTQRASNDVLLIFYREGFQFYVVSEIRK